MYHLGVGSSASMVYTDEMPKGVLRRPMPP